MAIPAAIHIFCIWKPFIDFIDKIVRREAVKDDDYTKFDIAGEAVGSIVNLYGQKILIP